MYGDAFVGPAPEPTKRDASRSVGVVVLAALLAFAGGAVTVAASSTQSWFPSRWDARVAPIAAEVARLRGLDFLHPVRIQYLVPKEFEKMLGGGGPVSASDRADIQREEAVFRSLGFIGGKLDLLKEFRTESSSGTLAFYSFAKKEIFVRGTTLDVEHRVTIAHELTHVLQDQHFDLTKLEQRAVASNAGDVEPLKALEEGDAVRIQQDYLKQLSKADQKEYDREYAAEGKRVGKETSTVPDIVSEQMSAPYDFGPSTIRVLLESGGNAAVNDALTGPTPSSGVFTKTGDVSAAVPVDPPLPPSDGRVVGTSDRVGPFETFLLLSTRIDPEQALEASDSVGGGAAITFESSGTTCYRVALDATSQSSRPFLLRAVQDWARGRTRTSVDPAGDLVGFTMCDPGKGASDPSSARFQAAIELLMVRTELTVSAAGGRGDADVARCVGRVFLERPGAEELLLAIGNNTPTAAQGAQVRQMAAESGGACRDNSDAGLH
jgi:hypothetical protein